MSRGRVVAALALLWASAGICGCGGSSSETLVAHVGGRSIGEHTLQHWMTLLGAGGGQTSKQRALGFLISSAWLTGEAQSHHLISASAVSGQLAGEYPGGATAIKEAAKRTGETPADLRLKAETQLAAARIRQSLVPDGQPVTAAQIAAYYGLHKASFDVPEQRYFDLANLHSVAEAMKLKREVQSGKSFSSSALQEKLPLPAGATRREPLIHMIYTAQPGVLEGPVLLKDVGDHSLFEVTRIVPGGIQPLAKATPAIRARLESERKQSALTSYIAVWRSRWIAKTDCQAGFVVQRCRGYEGARVPEAPLALE